MKKITKDKKNWFKVQFEKHPYLFTFVIGWIILYFIIDELIISEITGARFDDVLLIIFLSFPPIIFFLWFRKNKSIIIPFFKRRKKILKPIKSCLNKASNDEKIESVKSYIKSWIENWFKNPEIVKTLNLYG